MFNLPFPTDSLYKFAFMFGLALIVFSFYYQDNHLNKFDKKQLVYKRDSILSKWYQLIPAPTNPNDKLTLERPEISDVATVLSMIAPVSEDLMNQAKDINVKFNVKYPIAYPMLEQIFDRLNFDKREVNKFGLYESSDRRDYAAMDSLNSSIAEINKILNPVAMRIAVELNFIEEQIADYTRTLWFLRIIGFLLFFPSIFLWYFKIQKPQDKILQMQLVEAQKKSIVTGRKHFEPKILPRPKARKI